MIDYNTAAKLLHYSPATGQLSWKIGVGCMKAGTVASTITNNGYQSRSTN